MKHHNLTRFDKAEYREWCSTLESDTRPLFCANSTNDFVPLVYAAVVKFSSDGGRQTWIFLFCLGLLLSLTNILGLATLTKMRRKGQQVATLLSLLRADVGTCLVATLLYVPLERPLLGLHRYHPLCHHFPSLALALRLSIPGVVAAHLHGHLLLLLTTHSRSRCIKAPLLARSQAAQRRQRRLERLCPLAAVAAAFLVQAERYMTPAELTGPRMAGLVERACRRNLRPLSRGMEFFCVKAVEGCRFAALVPQGDVALVAFWLLVLCCLALCGARLSRDHRELQRARRRRRGRMRGAKREMRNETLALTLIASNAAVLLELALLVFESTCALLDQRDSGLCKQRHFQVGLAFCATLGVRFSSSLLLSSNIRRQLLETFLTACLKERLK